MQGGRYTPTVNPSYITFKKAFKDTNYVLTLNVNDTTPTDNCLTNASWNALTTTTAQVYEAYNGGPQTMPLMWTAHGFI